MYKILKLGSSRNLLTAMAAAVTCAGCVVGPDYRLPAAAEVASFTRQPASEIGIGNAFIFEKQSVSPQWWTAYRSERINVLVSLALQRNPSIEAGLASLRSAQEIVNAQRGLFFPSIQAGYTASRQSIGNVVSTPLAAGDTLFTLHTAQLTVGFVPDVFGGNQRQVESLKATANSQLYQLEALKITLASNVVAAVIQEKQLMDQIDTAQLALKVSAEQLQQSKTLTASGYTSSLDTALQQAAFSQTQALLPPLQKQLEQTRNLLAVLCGQVPVWLALPDAAKDISVPTALPILIPANLVERRPDVQAAQELYHASFAQIGVATANLLPQFNISAVLGFNSNMLSGLLGNDNRSWSLLGGLTQPLFAGGALRARKRGAEAVAEAAQAQYQTVVLTAFQNVADTLYALEADNRSVIALRDVEAANQTVFAQTSRQFILGYSSKVLVLAAQQAVLQAQLARIAANATYLGDTVSLYQALGGGWQKPDIKPANLR